MLSNIRTELEDILFGDPQVLNRLVDDISSLDRYGLNIYTPQALDNHSSLAVSVNDINCIMSTKIAHLGDELENFESSSSKLSEADIDEIVSRLEKCHSLAEDIHSCLGVLFKAAFSLSGVDTRNAIHKLSLKKPDSAYEYPRWIADCSILGSIVSDNFDPDKSINWAEILPEELSTKPENIRTLSMLNTKDSQI